MKTTTCAKKKKALGSFVVFMKKESPKMQQIIPFAWWHDHHSLILIFCSLKMKLVLNKLGYFLEALTLDKGP